VAAADRRQILVTRAALLLVLAAPALGCDWTATFACETREDCIDGRAGGVCEPDGHCSFADTECESGRRYGEHSPPGFAGTCVPAFDDEPGVVIGIAESSSSAAPETTTDRLPAGEDDTSAAGSEGGTSELPATAEEESSSGDAEDTDTGTETSTGGEPQDCNALDCASCLDCVASPSGPCDDELTACTDANGCTSGVACMQECVLYGTCFDDCCLGDVGPLVDDVVLCAADHCIDACGDYEFLTCA